MERADHLTFGMQEAAEVGSIWRLVAKHAGTIVKLNDGWRDPPIYCVHPISGDVVGLRVLAEQVGGHPMFGIQVPKQKMTARFAASIEDIARDYVGRVLAAQPKGAIILAGWSVGAVIALEMAQQLRALGRDVPLLVALDGAPCNTGAGLRPWQPAYLVRLLRNLPRWIRDDVDQDWSPLGVWRRINFKLAARFGVGTIDGGLRAAETMDAGLVQNVLDVHGWSADQTSFMHALYKATLDYVPSRYEGRVVVYEMLTQPLYHLRQVGAAWRGIADRVEIVQLQGNHSAITQEPSIGRIARHLLATLAELRHDEAGAPRGRVRGA